MAWQLLTPRFSLRACPQCLSLTREQSPAFCLFTFLYIEMGLQQPGTSLVWEDGMDRPGFDGKQQEKRIIRATSALDVRQILSSCKGTKHFRLCSVPQCGRDLCFLHVRDREGNSLAKSLRASTEPVYLLVLLHLQMPKSNTVHKCFF